MTAKKISNKKVIPPSSSSLSSRSKSRTSKKKRSSRTVVSELITRAQMDLDSLADAKLSKTKREDLDNILKIMAKNLRRLTKKLKENDMAASRFCHRLRGMKRAVDQSSLNEEEKRKFNEVFSAYFAALFSLKNTSSTAATPIHSFLNDYISHGAIPNAVPSDDKSIREEPFSSQLGKMEEFTAENTASVVKRLKKFPLTASEGSIAKRSAHPPGETDKSRTDVEVESFFRDFKTDVLMGRKISKQMKFGEMPAPVSGRSTGQLSLPASPKATLRKSRKRAKSWQSSRRSGAHDYSNNAERIDYDSGISESNKTINDDFENDAHHGVSTYQEERWRFSHFQEAVERQKLFRIMLYVLLFVLFCHFLNIMVQSFDVPLDDCSSANDFCQRKGHCCFQACNMTYPKLFSFKLFGG